MIQTITNYFLHSAQEVIPVFAFAVLASIALEQLLPDAYLEKYFKNRSFIAICNASFLGALVPMCTCGMIPLAIKLVQKGLNWRMICAFLVAGNACSIPALWMTTVLGYEVMLVRFVASVMFGVMVTYALSTMVPDDYALEINPDLVAEQGCCKSSATTQSCKFDTQKAIQDLWLMIKSFLPWILFAILVASLFHYVFVHPSASDGRFMDLILGANPWLAAAIGFPFYFCAGADVPISQELLGMGLPLGTIISFMLAAPGINLTSFLIYREAIGIKQASVLCFVSYLIAVILGLLVNSFV